MKPVAAVVQMTSGDTVADNLASAGQWLAAAKAGGRGEQAVDARGQWWEAGVAFAIGHRILRQAGGRVGQGHGRPGHGGIARIESQHPQRAGIALGVGRLHTDARDQGEHGEQHRQAAPVNHSTERTGEHA